MGGVTGTETADEAEADTITMDALNHINIIA